MKKKTDNSLSTINLKRTLTDAFGQDLNADDVCVMVDKDLNFVLEKGKPKIVTIPRDEKKTVKEFFIEILLAVDQSIDATQKRVRGDLWIKLLGANGSVQLTTKEKATLIECAEKYSPTVIAAQLFQILD